MASVNLQSEHGDGDGYSSPERSVRVSVSSPAETTSLPVVSISSPAEAASSSTSPVQVAINSAHSSYDPASVNPTSTPNNVAHPGQRSMRGGGQGHGHGQGRGYQEGNQHRIFNNRDRGGHRRGGYIQPYPFIPPPMPRPVGLFGNNVLYRDGTTGIIYFLAPPHPPLFPTPIYIPIPYHLLDEIRKQIDFYFSIDNLVKDTYLRLHMDEQGWVHVNLIAGFNKVSCLTDNVQLILYVMQTSNVVEVQGDKMRRRDDWMRWLMPPGVQHPLGSQSQGIGSDEGRQLQPGGGDRPPLA